MNPGQRHAVLATLALVPAAIYEGIEIKQGPDGWPYSRFLGLLPPAVFLAGLAVANGWLCPHIIRGRARRALASLASLAGLVDDQLASFDNEE